MISYEIIDKIDNIDFNKTEKYQPYVCNGCHDFSMNVQNLNDFFIVTVKNIDYRVYIVGADKKGVIYLLNNYVLDDKSVI